MSPSHECVAIIIGLLAVNVVSGAIVVFVSELLERGLDPLFIIYSSCFATSFFLLPFAFALERKEWPERLRCGLLLRFVLLAVGGVTVFQVLVLLGVKRTSPPITASMMNLSPGFTFAIACCLRFERVDMKCIYGKAKIIGTITCLGGAIAMSFLQDLPSTPTKPPSSGEHAISSALPPSNVEWIIGCACIFAAVFISSCVVILQADTLREFPSPLSISVAQSLLGGFLTAAIQFIAEGRLNVGSSPLSAPVAAAGTFLIGLVIGTGGGFQTWCIKKLGPVWASMFSPVGTVSSAVLSTLILGKNLSFGSVVGIAVMFIGLYLVLWAKGSEHSTTPADGGNGDSRNPTCDDLEIAEPLLS